MRLDLFLVVIGGVTLLLMTRLMIDLILSILGHAVVF